MSIHSTAIIDKEAVIDKGATIGPYSVIRGRTKIGPGTVVENHVTIGSEYGIVEIGEKNHFLPGAVVGGPPQDLSYKGEATRLKIGNGNTIREYVTLNLGTKKGTGETVIGNNNLIMAYSHIAHDCVVGNGTVIANVGSFAGHVTIEDNARIGGMCGAVQFVRIGKYAYIGGQSAMNKDILPFTIAQGTFAKCRATNKVGLERAGFTPEEVNNINRAVRFVLMGDRTIEEAVEKIKSECEQSENIKYMLAFIESSKTGIAR